jgi:hypothetical protein
MFGRFGAPKGLYDSARGFNPGKPAQPHRALKGRQTEEGKNTPLSCNHLSPFQGDSLDGMITQG